MRSLLSKYLLIIALALVFLPIAIPLSAIVIYNLFPKEETGPYRSGIDLDKQWHAEADKLKGAGEKEIREAMVRLRQTYEGSSVFWVDAAGHTRVRIPEELAVPDNWSPGYTVQFMKASYDRDPFTTVAFVGGEQDQGFVVLQLPRAVMAEESAAHSSMYNSRLAIGLLAILAFFLFISWLFFYRIRKRLLRLQQAMTSPGTSGFPDPVQVKQEDEIGRLEKAFNAMIGQLEDSRLREQEEQRLRQQLIANLSHDLRTPLTTLRGHAYSLGEEPITDKGRELIGHIDRKIDFMERLIENLFSYTLLTTGNYPFHPQRTEMVRLVRTLAANWYPVFEKEGFEFDLIVPEDTVHWTIDPHWMERILDNYFQNILRHARSGAYVAVRIAKDAGGSALLELEDHGPGLLADTGSGGAGLGLSLVALMMKENGLTSEVISGSEGTTIRIRQPRIARIE